MGTQGPAALQPHLASPPPPLSTTPPFPSPPPFASPGSEARIEGWAGYDEFACGHCRVRAVAVNKYTGMAKTVKGVPEHVSRPTSGWSHGKGKAKKRLLLHNKRLETQTEPNPAALVRLGTTRAKRPSLGRTGERG